MSNQSPTARESITADSIIEYAKQNGITLEQGAISYDYPKLCAANTLLHMCVGDDMCTDKLDRERISLPAIKYGVQTDKRIPFTGEEITYLEHGFERNRWVHEDHPMYLMGAEIARKIGY